MGRESVSTFYYAIEETYHIPEKDFPKKPQEVLKYFKLILGEAGFAVIRKVIIIEIAGTFKIEQSENLEATIELAKKKYIFEDTISQHVFQ